MIQLERKIPQEAKEQMRKSAIFKLDEETSPLNLTNMPKMTSRMGVHVRLAGLNERMEKKDALRNFFTQVDHLGLDQE